MRKAVALGVSLGSAGFLLSDKYQRAAVLNFVRVGGAAVKMAFIYSFDLEDSHRRAARALFNAFLANGGLFIKFGQLIAGLDVIVPDAYREVFSGIFKGKQAMSLTEVANAF
jgi:predicted unusual protein kinase regulating ubiquinone biosynthesis (AarF/ABC1/UbiB family)